MVVVFVKLGLFFRDLGYCCKVVDGCFSEELVEMVFEGLEIVNGELCLGLGRI